MCRWEQQWSRDTTSFPTEPHGDPLATAQRLAEKYRGYWK
jgi:hypothetical protein